MRVVYPRVATCRLIAQIASPSNIRHRRWICVLDGKYVEMQIFKGSYSARRGTIERLQLCCFPHNFSSTPSRMKVKVALSTHPHRDPVGGLFGSNSGRNCQREGSERTALVDSIKKASNCFTTTTAAAEHSFALNCFVK